MALDGLGSGMDRTAGYPVDRLLLLSIRLPFANERPKADLVKEQKMLDVQNIKAPDMPSFNPGRSRVFILFI